MAILLLLLLVLSLFIICMYLIFHHYHSQSNLRHLNLPPGSTGFPLIGETLQMISAYKSQNPEPFMESRVNRYSSKLFTTHLFGEKTVVSTDSEVNRFVLMNEGKLFESSYTSSISNLLGKRSLVLLKGNLHKKMYSLTMKFGNLNSIRDHHFASMDQLIQSNLNSWKNKIFLLDEAKKITFELTVKQLMSVDPGKWTEELRKHYLLLIDGFFSVPLPLFFTTYGKAIHARGKVLEEIKLKVMERRREWDEAKGNEVEDKEKKKDMLGILLNGEGGFSDEEVAEFLLALIVGGYETTSTIMTLAVKFLYQTPLALAELKKEHVEIRSKKQSSVALEWEDYKSMHFTQCVINESLRIANIVSGVFRRAISDVNIKGYTIPKGWMVFPCFRAVHLNQDNFKDATSFNPWRWQGERGAPSCNKKIFTPFGGGPRHCPGYEIARVEVSVFLHHFITRFSWTPSEEDKLVFFPTTRTLKGYPIDLHRQAPNSTAHI